MAGAGGTTTRDEAQERSDLIDIASYRVHLDLSSDGGTFRSDCEVEFGCRQPGSSTFVQVKLAAIDSAVLNGVELDPAAVAAGGRLELAPLAERNTLSIRGESRYSTTGRGLLRTEEAGDAYVYSLCFPTHAPEMFACFDQPDLRADVALSVTAAPAWTVVANGPELGEGERGRRLFGPEVMAPALASVCAGNFHAERRELAGGSGSVALGLYCRRSLARELRADDLAALLQDCLAYYEQALGVPCPYPKCDVLFVPGLSPVAVSVPGLVMFREELLPARRETPGRERTMIFAHELAHLWFGGLVSLQWWDDLWLEEALATYLSFQAVEATSRRPPSWAAFCMREKAAAYRADALPTTRAIAAPVADERASLARSNAITYMKGASVVRQLEAIVGDAALRAGLRAHLQAHADAVGTLDDLVGCVAEAAGRDLGPWAESWLRRPGVNVLTLSLDRAGDGTILDAAVLQSAGAGGSELRSHRVGIGLYEVSGGVLRRRHAVTVDVAGARTPLVALAGERADVVLLNDGDLTFSEIRLDAGSLRSLLACALRVDDPTAEGLCWTMAWHMTRSGELSAGDFCDLVVRRLTTPPFPPAFDQLLSYAVEAADRYAPPPQRLLLRSSVAASMLAACGTATSGSDDQHALAVGFAAAASDDSQLSVLREWLGSTGTGAAAGGPAGLVIDEELRWRALETLSARGMAEETAIDVERRRDLAAGEYRALTCRALRPSASAKASAWAAALSDGESSRTVDALARGFWVPGQDHLVADYRERYFTDVLPLAARRPAAIARLLVMHLYPATLVDGETLRLTEEALAGEVREAGEGLDELVATVLLERRTLLAGVLAARQRAAAAD